MLGSNMNVEVVQTTIWTKANNMKRSVLC